MLLVPDSAIVALVRISIDPCSSLVGSGEPTWNGSWAIVLTTREEDDGF